MELLFQGGIRMTKKQYAIVNMGLEGSLIKENGKIIDIERVVDLLNELTKENEKLKKELDCFEPQLFNDLIGEPITLYKKVEK